MGCSGSEKSGFDECCMHDVSPDSEHAPGQVCCWCGDVFLPVVVSDIHGEFQPKWPVGHDEMKSLLEDIASDGCAYGDNCPPFDTRHGQCLACKAKKVLSIPEDL